MVAKQEGRKNRVLFVCIENSSRSIMAEGFAKELGLEGLSAGTFPAHHVNSLVVEVMKEVGIDISHGRPKELTGTMIDEADLVVLTDASLESVIPGNFRKKMRRKVVRWNLPDPQGKTIDEIRYIRDDIKRMVERLARESAAR